VLLQLVSPGKGSWTLGALQWLGVNEDMVLELELLAEGLATLVAVVADLLLGLMLLQVSFELAPLALKDHLALRALITCDFALWHCFQLTLTSEFGLVW